MKNILEKYLDTEIGINYEKPFKIEGATLIGLYDNYFSISDHKNAYTHYFSYQSIVQIIEHKDGVDVGGLFTHTKRHVVVVKVGHLIEYVPA
jgi:hypothetical protein